MADFTTWILQDRVLLTYYTGPVTLEDLVGVQDRVKSLLATKTSTNLTHMIVDMKDVTEYPQNMHDLLDNINLFESDALG